MFHLLTFLIPLSVVLVAQGETSVTAPSHDSVQCLDWGVQNAGAVRVYQGEIGWLRCPLFSRNAIYSYASTQTAGLSLLWYWVQAGQTLEQPINLSLPGQRISKEGERLWLEPAAAEDAGPYICMLRNRTYCVKVTVQLEVIPRDSGVCVATAAVDHPLVNISLEAGKTLHCPDLEEFQLSHKVQSVTWFHNCRMGSRWNGDREVKGHKLVVHIMRTPFAGNYTCVVTSEKALSFTRVVNVRAISSYLWPKNPVIHNPDEHQVFTVKLGSEAHLVCRVLLPLMEGEPEPQVWWDIDGTRVEQLSDPRITNKCSSEVDSLGDQVKECVLLVQDFTSHDLQRNYTCHGRNSRAHVSKKAVLKAEKYLPSVELGCGLGVTLFLMLVLFVVYHVYRLELLLLYRAYCGTDESATDGKEYDVYISYARNSEEEEFVLLTLRRVLENELGYKVFIYDRDSLPGGTITDETLRYVGRSRRLMVVLSPRYVLQGTQALLELKAGLDTMARAGDLRVVLVQYQRVSRASWVRELRRARVALALIQWKGEKSSDLSSRFWKQLQVELPIRRAKATHSDDNAVLPLTMHTYTDSK
ncbi:interleukin-1 receptor accessory protein [Megalops cyprinoides]|uniref:interleukin-1 receptor accessory protein n=1 Tax=Megalops cyprinoides TaxID=118141 RepID=UPI001864BD42|nr:interleukin-1 receptor accessory protein [Megalops cyprinoides]XP_036393057.1 interleukin-1 receptor accessory protein [Megalops cyprinoides]